MAGSRAFTDDEVKTILDYFGQPEQGLPGLRNRALFQLGVSTGFRISEMLKLRMYDVYRNNRVTGIVKNRRRNRKGKHSGQTKKLPKRTQKYLEEWILAVREENKNLTLSAPLFISKKGGPIIPTSFYHMLRDACVACGVDDSGVGTHSMRKTFASTMYDYYMEKARNGYRIEVMRAVQQELGHKVIDSTYRYLSFKLEDKPDELFEYD